MWCRRKGDKDSMVAIDTPSTHKSSPPLSGCQALILQTGSDVNPQEMEPQCGGAPLRPPSSTGANTHLPNLGLQG